MPIKTATLNVPGADLYHEVRGACPVLVMMPGSHSAEFAVKLREVLEGV